MRETVVSLRHAATYVRVYNLSVEDVHTYYVAAGSISTLVHNCGMVPRNIGTHGPAYDLPRWNSDLALGLDHSPTTGQRLLGPFAKGINAGTYDDYALQRGNVSWGEIRGMIQDHVDAGGTLRFNLAGMDDIPGALAGTKSWMSFTDRELQFVCTQAIRGATQFYGGADPC
jgi:hypothetical protein